MHSTVSDGTDAPEALLERVREAGLELFALTDHDAIKGCAAIRHARQADDPPFINGVEFSCRDDEGKYHILGYGYDPDRPSIQDVVEKGHNMRMMKLSARLDFLRTKFGFTFPEDEVQRLKALDNPGKPHIGNLMVKYGYAESKEQAIDEYLDQANFPNEYVRPEEAIEGILQANGIPVLAHPAFGSGNELILGDAMEQRLLRLIDFGLRGVEGFYSGFSHKLQLEMLYFAKKYNLYVTAGSDYHGKNKLITLGDTNVVSGHLIPSGMKRFLKDVSINGVQG